MYATLVESKCTIKCWIKTSWQKRPFNSIFISTVCLLILSLLPSQGRQPQSTPTTVGLRLHVTMETASFSPYCCKKSNPNPRLEGKKRILFKVPCLWPKREFFFNLTWFLLYTNNSPTSKRRKVWSLLLWKEWQMVLNCHEIKPKAKKILHMGSKYLSKEQQYIRRGLGGITVMWYPVVSKNSDGVTFKIVLPKKKNCSA